MEIIQNLLVALVLFFIQPTFIAGVILAWFSKNRRVTYSRSQLRSAIYRDNYELKRFFLWGLIPGLVISLTTVIMGIPLTLEWIILYHIITLVSLGVGYRFVHPMFTFSATGLVLLLLNKLDIHPLNQLNLPSSWINSFEIGSETGVELSQTTLVIALLILLSTVITLQFGDTSKFTPRFLKTPRGKIVARYRMTPFWLVPILLVIPGRGFGALFDWWPLFEIGGQTYSFFILPALVGFRYTVQAQLPSQAENRLLKEMTALAFLTILFFIGTLFIDILAPITLGLLIIGGFIVLYRHRKREQRWTFEFGPADQGMRVVAVKPESPAEKMGLDIGDTLLSCNGTELSEAESFYGALSANRSYCKLKIRRKDGEIILVESAIYEEDPHDLGMILLEEIELP